MKSFIKEYLTYSNSDKKGIFFLLILVFIFISAPYFIEYVHVSPPSDFTKFEKEVDLFEKNLNKKDDNIKEPVGKLEASDKKVMFVFNPNKLPKGKWRELGLKEFQINMIYKFESKGGRFRKKEDFKKMYCIKLPEYLLLEPYIAIPVLPEEPSFFKKSTFTKNISKTSTVIDLNTADSANLVNLRGIGPVFASRIIKYRKKLGGFYKKEQLLEVYGLDSILYIKIASEIILNDFSIQKININLADAVELRKHPYFSYKIATSVINYRKAHGEYKDISEIKKILLVNEELYLKLVNYITIN